MTRMSFLAIFSDQAMAATGNAAAFGTVIDPIVSNIVTPLIQLAFAVAVVVFVYGVAQLIMYGDDADKRKKGQWSILMGSIGIVIMLSAWGIVYLVANTVRTFP